MSRKNRKKKDRLLIQKRMEAPPTYPEIVAQADPEPELKPEIASVSVKTMSIDSILGQLASMKDNAQSFLHTPPEPDDDIWLADIAAIEAATAILSALQDEGVADAEKVKDLIFDYQLANKQLQVMTAKYEKATAPVNLKGKTICPECSAIIHHGWWKHCPDCGKRIGGR